jgi:hypothetical protein
MKDGIIKSLRQLQAKAQSLLAVADYKLDQTQPILLQIKKALEKLESDLSRRITDVEIVKDEFEANAQVFLNAVLEKEVPDFTSRLQTQEQALRTLE